MIELAKHCIWFLWSIFYLFAISSEFCWQDDVIQNGGRKIDRYLCATIIMSIHVRFLMNRYSPLAYKQHYTHGFPPLNNDEMTSPLSKCLLLVVSVHGWLFNSKEWAWFAHIVANSWIFIYDDKHFWQKKKFHATWRSIKLHTRNKLASFDMHPKSRIDCDSTVQ